MLTWMLLAQVVQRFVLPANGVVHVQILKINPKDARHKAVNAYVIMDYQSNRSLAKPEFFDHFGLENKSFLGAQISFIYYFMFIFSLFGNGLILAIIHRTAAWR